MQREVLSYLLKHIGVKERAGIPSGLHNCPSMAHLFSSPHTALAVVSISMYRGCSQDLLPVASLTPSQLSSVCTWKIFLAWSLVNNCLERGQKLSFGPWRKMMIRSSGRYEKIWASFIFWELISWKSHSPGSSGCGKEVCSTYGTCSWSFSCLHIFVFSRMSYSWSHTGFSDWLFHLKMCS